jgi:ubiquinone biosynthesis monooxygenase Coq7
VLSMALVARLNSGETLGDRVIKVDHAGEHGAVCIYLAQRWLARWRAPEMVPELDHFLAHERGHRARFGDELTRRGQRRCRSYFWCGLGGFVLGAVTGIAGRSAIAATTVAIERVVLGHMQEQVEALTGIDDEAVRALREIIVEEQQHHDLSAARLPRRGVWPTIINPVVGVSTRVVIWLGMRL